MRKGFCAFFFFLLSGSFVLASDSVELGPPEIPVRIILNYHGDFMTPSSVMRKNIDETVRLLEAQVEKEDPRRPVILWLEYAVPHRQELSAFLPDYFVSELAAETGMTRNQALWALLRPESTPPVYVQRFNQALQIKYRRAQKAGESFLTGDFRKINAFLGGLIDWYDRRKKTRPMELKMEIPPYDSWVWSLRWGLWSQRAAEDLLKGEVETALKEQFFSLAALAQSVLTRDKKLAEDIAYERGFSPEALQLVSRGAAHESFEKRLAQYGVRSRSFAQYDMKGDPLVDFLNRDFSKAGIFQPGYLLTEEERIQSARTLLKGMALQQAAMRYAGALAFVEKELDRAANGLSADQIQEWIVTAETLPKKSALSKATWEWLLEKPNRLKKILEDCRSSHFISDIEIPFGEEKWDLTHEEAGFGESENQYLPERDTEDRWTQKLTVHFFLGVTDLKSGLARAAQIKNRILSVCRDNGWKEVQPGENDTMYLWTVWNCEGVSNRSELLRVAVTPAGCYLLRYAYAAEKMPDEKYERWTRILNSVRFSQAVPGDG